jgi:putative DNA primase/helicase
MRRLIIIPFNAKFGEGQAGYEPFIGDKLKDEESMEYLICLAIKGLKRVLENRAFTKSEKSQAELEEFEETNNPILGFFKEMDSDDSEHIENQPTATVYRRYQEYCIENNLTPMSKGEFSKQVKKHYNFSIVSRRIDKKVYRIFVKGE